MLTSQEIELVNKENITIDTSDLSLRKIEDISAYENHPEIILERIIFYSNDEQWVQLPFKAKMEFKNQVGEVIKFSGLELELLTRVLFTNTSLDSKGICRVLSNMISSKSLYELSCFEQKIITLFEENQFNIQKENYSSKIMLVIHFLEQRLPLNYLINLKSYLIELKSSIEL